MAYNCQYAIDRGVACKQWTTPDATYCTEHEAAIQKIETMWKEVVAVIKKALEK